MIYVFDQCTFDSQLRTLHRQGQAVGLRPQVFQVLLYLIENRERVISKQELVENIWPGQFISDAAIESCIRRVRQATGDDGRNQRIVRTLHGHGYHFVSDITIQDETTIKVIICMVCQHDNLPETLYCARCGTPLAKACPICDHVTCLPAASCAMCGRTLEQTLITSDPISPSMPTDNTQPSAEISAPWEIKEPMGERKLITTLHGSFIPASFSESTSAPDFLHRFIRPLYRLAEAIVSSYGGALQPVSGNRFTALFGVPTAQEDHAKRAVFAALELMQQWLERREALNLAHSQALPVCIAIYTGLVVVDELSDQQPSEISIVGSSEMWLQTLHPFMALQTILCSEATAKLVQAEVRLKPLSSSHSGQQSRLVAYQVLGRSSPYTSNTLDHQRSLTPLVERERELATLLAVLDQVETGHGHIATVVGDPGIGKSRLLYEFQHISQTRQITYIKARCLSYGQSTPYLPVIDLIRQSCNIFAADVQAVIYTKIGLSLQEVGMDHQTWTPYISQLLGLPPQNGQQQVLSPEIMKPRVFEALLHLCLGGSQLRPLVIEIEDLHWCDATSEEVLTELAQHLAGVPILLLATYRPGYRSPWMEKSYVTQLALPQLSPHASQQVLEAILEALSYPPRMTSELLAKAEGNPFFLEELAWMVREQEVLDTSVALPTTVQAVVAARIDQLPPQEKRLLQIAAIIGKDIPISLLPALVQQPEDVIRDQLEQLQAKEFLYITQRQPVLTYTFKHALTQETAYQSLLPETRQPYHARIATLLTERFPDIVSQQPGLVAHHYTEAGAISEAIYFWELAGQHAMQRSAHIEAISHLEKGLTLLLTQPSSEERVRQELMFNARLGTSYATTRGYASQECGSAYARARELLQQMGEHPQLLHTLQGLWTFYLVRADYKTARELSDRFIRLAQHQHSAPYLPEAYFMVGETLFFIGQLSEADATLEKGLAIPRDADRMANQARSITDPLVKTLVRRAMIRCLLGFIEQGHELNDEALAIANQIQHPFSQVYALSCVASFYLFLRDATQTAKQAEAAITLSSEKAFSFWRALATVLHGWAMAQQGLGEAGVKQIQDGIAGLRNTGTIMLEPWYALQLAESLGTLGKWEEGLVAIDHGLNLIDKTAEHVWEAELHRIKGECLLNQSTPDKQAAEHCYDTAISVAQSQQAKLFELRAAVSRCTLWQQQGQHHEAFTVLSDIYHWFPAALDIYDLRQARALLDELA